MVHVDFNNLYIVVRSLISLVKSLEINLFLEGKSITNKKKNNSL